MKNKTITITIIAMLTLSSFGLLFTTLLTPAAAAPVFDFGPEAIDVTPEMIGEEEVAIREYAAEVGSAIATGASLIGDPAVVGSELVVNVGNFDPDNDNYDETFIVLMDGVNGIILIEKDAYDNYDATTDEYVFANPNEVWRSEDRISTTQLSDLLIEFDTNIYLRVTGIFGALGLRGDPGDAHKVWILIHNIRDESYYDPAQTSYVAGYFSASENSIENKNMFHIDSYDWENRVGPDGGRPYLYEGVFAHEFEHMVHFDQDPDEPSWVDEGLADLAGYLCGYGHSDGHLMYYMAYHPMTSLTFWGGQLEDYGMSYLFQFYLFEHYGGEPFVTALVQEQANGIEGIEKTLAAFLYEESFDEIFDAWTIANYLDDTSENPLYGYELLDIGGPDTRYWTIDYAVEYWDSPPYIGKKPLNSDWFYGIEPLPYTAHYFHIRNRSPATIVLDGADFSGTLPHSGMYEWYSGAGAWSWGSLSQSFSIPAEGMTTLNFWTWYDIEQDWDYGYVEVYDGAEWYTLEDMNGHTISTDPNGPQDNPNTPVGQEPADYLVADRWHAFTGYSGGWVEVSMDLTQFTGKTIDLYFRLWQDGAFTLQNMYVDDIEITNGVFALDNVESGPDGWAADGWYRTDGMNDNNFGVILLEKVNNNLEVDEIRNMDVDPVTETGIMFVDPISKKSGFIQVAIVTNHADHIIATHYDFRLYGGYQWFR